MPPYALALLAILAAHLIGAVPFAYLLVWWRKGIDVRTVGSGNVGATNAARVLGFRFFLVIFALDFAKGFLPTWGLPRLVQQAGGDFPSLPVLVALAAILGHNFPVYLRFRGGKGVATSLGALSALDPIASAGAVAGFVACLLATRFVSLSSVVGAAAFLAVHFARTAHPWSQAERAMSLVTIGLFAMLTWRHRKNFQRIAAGTEPKVPLGRSRTRPPRGFPTEQEEGSIQGGTQP
jgi:glycerol-3-phosphate acyltransferase PlsY